MSQLVRRLFVDPASRKTGWAFFIGKECVEHGAIQYEDKDAYLRMRDIYLDYFELGDRLQPDQCFVEDFRVFSTKRGGLVIGSHYVIAAALRCYAPVEAIWTQKWQDFAGYKKGETPTGPLAEYAEKAESEDVLAAIGMGLWYVRDK